MFVTRCDKLKAATH